MVTKVKSDKTTPYRIKCDAQDIEDILSALSFFQREYEPTAKQTKKAMRSLEKRLKASFY